MLGIRCDVVGECQSEDPFVWFGTKPAQRACERDLPWDQNKTREGRFQRRIEKWTEQRSRQNFGEADSQEKEAETWAVGRREQELGPKDPEAWLAYVRGWVSVPGGFVRISLEYTLALAHKCTESYAKVSQTSPFLR